MRQMGKGTCRWCGHWLNAWRNSWGLPWGFMNVCPACGRRQGSCPVSRDLVQDMRCLI
jgi:hypothetical protein